MQLCNKVVQNLQELNVLACGNQSKKMIRGSTIGGLKTIASSGFGVNMFIANGA
jgi:hypothetical protein